MELLVDNKSSIHLVKNLMYHGRNKHIGTKFYFLRDQVNMGRIKLKHYKTEV